MTTGLSNPYLFRDGATLHQIHTDACFFEINFYENAASGVFITLYDWRLEATFLKFYESGVRGLFIKYYTKHQGICMRIHLVNLGHKTSISVDDQLLDYLQKRLIQQGECKRPDKTKVRLWIQHMVDASVDQLPSKGLSQWVQARIIDVIADPLLKDEAKKAEEAELTLRNKNLADQRLKAWFESENSRKEQVKKKEMYEKIAKDIGEKIPRYRSPPR